VISARTVVDGVVVSVIPRVQQIIAPVGPGIRVGQLADGLGSTPVSFSAPPGCKVSTVRRKHLEPRRWSSRMNFSGWPGRPWMNLLHAIGKRNIRCPVEAQPGVGPRLEVASGGRGGLHLERAEKLTGCCRGHRELAHAYARADGMICWTLDTEHHNAVDNVLRAYQPAPLTGHVGATGLASTRFAHRTTVQGGGDMGPSRKTSCLDSRTSARDPGPIRACLGLPTGHHPDRKGMHSRRCSKAIEQEELTTL